MVPERERHVAVEQQLGVALVRQVGPPASEEHQLHHAALLRRGAVAVKPRSTPQRRGWAWKKRHTRAVAERGQRCPCGPSQ